MEASSSRIRIELSKLFSSPCAPNEITSRLIDFFSACLTKCNFVTSQQQMLFWEWALQRARKSRWELWRMDGQDHTLGLGLRGIDCARALSGLKPRVAAWGRTCCQVQWQRPLMFTLTKGLTHTTWTCLVRDICSLSAIFSWSIPVLCHRTASNQAHICIKVKLWLQMNRFIASNVIHHHQTS